MSFDSQFHAGHKLIVYPEAVLGASGNIRVTITRATDDFVVPSENWHYEEVTPGEPGLILVQPFRDGYFAQELMDANATWNSQR